MVLSSSGFYSGSGSYVDHEDTSRPSADKPLNDKGKDWVARYTHYRKPYLDTQAARVKKEAAVIVAQLLKTIQKSAELGKTSVTFTLGHDTAPDFDGTISIYTSFLETKVSDDETAETTSAPPPNQGWSLFHLLSWKSPRPSSASPSQHTGTTTRVVLPSVLHVLEIKKLLESEGGIPNLVNWDTSRCVVWRKLGTSYIKSLWQSSKPEIHKKHLQCSHLLSEHAYLTAQLEDEEHQWLDRVETITFDFNWHLYMLKNMGITAPVKTKKKAKHPEEEEEEEEEEKERDVPHKDHDAEPDMVDH